jgi:hypothetical protein
VLHILCGFGVAAKVGQPQPLVAETSVSSLSEHATGSEAGRTQRTEVIICSGLFLAIVICHRLLLSVQASDFPFRFVPKLILFCECSMRQLLLPHFLPHSLYDELLVLSSSSILPRPQLVLLEDRDDEVERDDDYYMILTI